MVLAVAVSMILLVMAGIEKNILMWVAGTLPILSSSKFWSIEKSGEQNSST